MRPDFNKLLVERERIGHRNSYHENRKHKAFDVADGDGPIGGRESMKVRHKYAWGGKRFNENLRPLKNWLQSVLGKKWDKSYSELRQTFDARSVINNHILQHLFQYVEINAKVIDGKVMVLRKYGHREGDVNGYAPVKNCDSEFYVCPKDGTLKRSTRETYKSVMKARRVEADKLEKSKKRIIDKYNELHLIDDVWYHIVFKDLPPSKIVYSSPYPHDPLRLFNVRPYVGEAKWKAWEELNEMERARFGVRRHDAPGAYDILKCEYVHQSDHRYRPITRYAASKQTASKKMLKKAGIS